MGAFFGSAAGLGYLDAGFWGAAEWLAFPFGIGIAVAGLGIRASLHAVTRTTMADWLFLAFVIVAVATAFMGADVGLSLRKVVALLIAWVYFAKLLPPTIAVSGTRPVARVMMAVLAVLLLIGLGRLVVMALDEHPIFAYGRIVARLLDDTPYHAFTFLALASTLETRWRYAGIALATILVFYSNLRRLVMALGLLKALFRRDWRIVAGVFVGIWLVAVLAFDLSLTGYAVRVGLLSGREAIWTASVGNVASGQMFEGLGNSRGANLVLQLLEETSVVGLVTFSGFLGCVYYTIWQHAEQHWRALAVGLGSEAVVVSTMFLAPAHFGFQVVMLVYAIAVSATLTASSQQASA